MVLRSSSFSVQACGPSTRTVLARVVHYTTYLMPRKLGNNCVGHNILSSVHPSVECKVSGSTVTMYLQNLLIYIIRNRVDVDIGRSPAAHPELRLRRSTRKPCPNLAVSSGSRKGPGARTGDGRYYALQAPADTNTSIHEGQQGHLVGVGRPGNSPSRIGRAHGLGPVRTERHHWRYP